MFSKSTFRSFALLALGVLPVAKCVVHEVVVGGPGILKYTPESVTAVPGDTIRFIFQQKNHTATQSTFANPCVQAPGGFDSGYIPVADDVTSGFRVAEFNITNTDPIWVFCKQGTHCKAGMVFAVNPGDRMEAFKANAAGNTAPAPTATTVAPTGTAASTPTPSGTEIRVVVGGPGSLAFNPPNIVASPGDKIVFEFRQKNHAVVASSFDAPCVPLSQSTPGQAGFNSGFFPVADGETQFPTWSVTVNDTKPIWAYCPQVGHCGQGMVFSANAAEGTAKSFNAFQELAKQLNGTGSSTTGGYGSGAAQTKLDGASAALAAILAIAALL